MTKKHDRRRRQKVRVRRAPRLRRRTPPGTAPGTLRVHPNAPPPIIRVLAYGPQRVDERQVDTIEQLQQWVGKHSVVWIAVEGLGDAETIQRLGKMFGLHPLALEDVVNVHQRAKVEPYDDHLFVVTRSVTAAETANGGEVESEQISIFLGKNFVLTFQQRADDCLEPVRDRIRHGNGRIRTAGPDYLAYALIDAVVDSYFPVVERYADRLDDLEDEVTSRPKAMVTQRLHGIRNDLLMLRRSVRPHREALNQLARDPHPLVSDETRVFLRDCYDHVIQLIDLLEVYRESCADLRDYYLSAISNRMNEIMTVLTTMATIFIPLSFIASLYGMNFNTALAGNMPELNWPYGYVMVLSLMSGIALAMLVIFRRKGWIGVGRDVITHTEHLELDE